MRAREYLLCALERVEEAEGRGDRIEMARLLRLIAAAMIEQAEKLERAAAVVKFADANGETVL